jgi:putative PIN family toxin of toxin-antitoxin system
MGKKSEVIVVLDSNVFLSALITPTGNSAFIYKAWLSGTFALATCREQLEEIKTASRNPKFGHILQPQEVGIMLNRLRRANVISEIPRKHDATDPTDAFLLNLAVAVSAHFLVTGDKRSGLLERNRVDGTRILSPGEFCLRVLRKIP